MIESIFIALGRRILGVLFEEFWLFVERLRAQRADDQPLDDFIGKMVREVAARTDLDTWQKKVSYASDRTLEWLGALGRDVERALVNAKIDTKVAAYRERGIIR